MKFSTKLVYFFPRKGILIKIFILKDLDGMLRDRWWKILLTEEHRAKICMDMICEFLHLRPDYSTDKCHMSVNDYTLKQFQSRVGKKIPYNPRDKKAEKEKRERLLALEREDG